MTFDIFKFLKLVLLSGILSTHLYAYETDQYSTSFYELKDSTEQIDLVVNNAIEHVVNNWNKARNDYKLGSRIAGFFHSRQFEKWVNDNPDINSRNVKSDSVFKTTGWETSFIIKWKGLSPSFTLNNIQIGTDKLSHFFGVGWIYWKKSEVEHKGETEEERRTAAIKEGLFTEETYWGRLLTNVFSNADLVANWEGYLFFRGLLEDNIVNGKKALIRWEGDRPVIQRKFTFRDHVSDFWSESLLPSDYDSLLSVKVKNVLRTYCKRPQFIKTPEKWVSRNFDFLWHKYESLRLDRDAIEYRLDKVCEEFSTLTENEKKEFLREQAETESSYVDSMSGQDSRRLNIEPVLGRIIERIESAVPGCNGDIESAINEHKMLTEFVERFLPGMKRKLKIAAVASANAKPDEFSRENFNKASVKFFKAVLGKIIQNRIKTNNWNNILRNRLAKRIKINKKKVLLVAESTNYGDELIKQCLILPIKLANSSLPVRADFIKVSIYHCNYSNIHTGETKSSTFWRAYDTGKKLRSSMEGYFGLEDREAYIYRLIPKACKWY